MFSIRWALNLFQTSSIGTQVTAAIITPIKELDYEEYEYGKIKCAFFMISLNSKKKTPLYYFFIKYHPLLRILLFVSAPILLPKSDWVESKVNFSRVINCLLHLICTPNCTMWTPTSFQNHSNTLLQSCVVLNFYSEERLIEFFERCRIDRSVGFTVSDDA